MMVKLGMIKAISFTIITWNPESNLLYVPREETCPTPLQFVDVTRTTDTSLDAMLEENINDHWKVDGDRELPDTWTVFI